MPLGSGAIVIVFPHRPTWPRQLPFGPGKKPRCPASYAGRPAEGWPTAPVSCRLSATGVRFLAIHIPLGGWASLTVGLPAPATEPDPNGVVTLHLCETRPGWAPFVPRGRRCPSSHGVVRPGWRLPHHSGKPLHLGAAPIHPRLAMTGGHQGFTVVRPSGLPLACCPRTGREHLGLSPELHTPPLPATHVGVGTGTGHYLGSSHRRSGPPFN